MKIFAKFFNKIRPAFRGVGLFNGLLLIAFLSLIASEQRFIKYHLFGARIISIVDVLFLTVCVFSISLCYKKVGFNGLVRKILPFWYIFLPFLLLVLLYLVPPFNSGNFSIRSYLLGGLGIFTIFSFLTLSKYREGEIVKFVFWYTVITVGFFLLIYIFTRIARFRLFMYGEATPALYFPFSSPSQAALFGTVVFLLAVGTILALGRKILLYVVVPIMAIAIFQSGSRSGFWLLICAWILFLILHFVGEKFILNKKPLQSTHLMISTALSIIVLFLTVDKQGFRSVSLLKAPIKTLVSGTADSWRGEKWAMLSSKTPINNEMTQQPAVFVSSIPAAPVPAAPVPAAPVPAAPVSAAPIQGSLHNIYLDFFASGGFLALALFVLFVFNLFISFLVKIWQNRASKNYPFYLSMGLAFFVILGGFYSNPVLHLRFIWVFWGFVLAMLYSLNNASSKVMSGGDFNRQE